MKNNTTDKTILVITLGFIIVHLLLEQAWAIYVAVSIGLLGVSSSWLATKIESFWFKLADLLSKIVPTILLTLIFYLFLFPISLISKLFTNDPLLLKNSSKTTFKDVSKVDIKTSMEKTW